MAFGGYVNNTQVIAAASQTAIQNILATLEQTFTLNESSPSQVVYAPNPITGSSTRAASPDFDEMNPATRRLIFAELAALRTAIGAAPAV